MGQFLGTQSTLLYRLLSLLDATHDLVFRSRWLGSTPALFTVRNVPLGHVEVEPPKAVGTLLNLSLRGHISFPLVLIRGIGRHR